jgi:hypothetical protein
MFYTILEAGTMMKARHSSARRIPVRVFDF